MKSDQTTIKVDGVELFLISYGLRLLKTQGKDNPDIRWDDYSRIKALANKVERASQRITDHYL